MRIQGKKTCKLYSILQIFTRQSEMVRLFVECSTYFNLKRIFDWNAVFFNGQMSTSTEHFTLSGANDPDLKMLFRSDMMLLIFK